MYFISTCLCEEGSCPSRRSNPLLRGDCFGKNQERLAATLSSESWDQCLVESSSMPEMGSLCQFGGKPVLTNSWAKYFISPLRIRSASSMAVCLFHGTFSGNSLSIGMGREDLAPTTPSFFTHVSSVRSVHWYCGICKRMSPVRRRKA